MEIKGSQTDFEAVLSDDYFERYDACENLLQANDIPLKISDLRQVFQHIIIKAALPRCSGCAGKIHQGIWSAC
jgi:hypothetical protein